MGYSDRGLLMWILGTLRPAKAMPVFAEDVKIAWNGSNKDNCRGDVGSSVRDYHADRATASFRHTEIHQSVRIPAGFIAPQVGRALWRVSEMTSAHGRWHLSAMACELVFAARLLVLQNFSYSLAIIAPWPKKQTKKKTKQCHFIFVCALHLLAIGGLWISM